MKILLLYEYPPPPGGLATQGDLLFRGLKEIGVDVHAANFTCTGEKEWYYKWLQPDVVIGVGFWGYTPQIILHPQRFNLLAVPWMVADGFIAEYQSTLNALPLILVTSNWVKQVYRRDGIHPHIMEVLPVGCDTDSFIPRDKTDPKIVAVRESLGIQPDELFIFTLGGDAASKGAQEVMQALAALPGKVPKWKYVCKVWDQERTEQQNLQDRELANRLGISQNVIYISGAFSRNFMPYLMAACDIYAAPARLEGFGMPQIEAGACGKPVIGIKAMAMLDTLVHGETAFLAAVAQEVRIREAVLADKGINRRVVFRNARVADYRASVHDLAGYLYRLMTDETLRVKMGEAGRKRVVSMYNYRVVAQTLVRILQDRLGLV